MFSKDGQSNVIPVNIGLPVSGHSIITRAIITLQGLFGPHSIYHIRIYPR